MPKNQFNEPPIDLNSSLGREYMPFLHDHIYGLGTDTTGSLNSADNLDTDMMSASSAATITGLWTYTTHPLGLDHTLISNIGTNTHPAIDTHIADPTIHFTQANITTVGTVTSGTWNATPITGTYIDESTVDHDALFNFAPLEHIDWTAATQNFDTSGTVTSNGLILGNNETLGWGSDATTYFDGSHVIHTTDNTAKDFRWFGGSTVGSHNVAFLIDSNIHGIGVNTAPSYNIGSAYVRVNLTADTGTAPTFAPRNGIFVDGTLTGNGSQSLIGLNLTVDVEPPATATGYMAGGLFFIRYNGTQDANNSLTGGTFASQLRQTDDTMDSHFIRRMQGGGFSVGTSYSQDSGANTQTIGEVVSGSFGSFNDGSGGAGKSSVIDIGLTRGIEIEDTANGDVGNSTVTVFKSYGAYVNKQTNATEDSYGIVLAGDGVGADIGFGANCADIELTASTNYSFADNGASADTITNTSLDFVALGFIAGSRISVRSGGTSTNKGVYTIGVGGVATNVLTLDPSDVLVNEATGVGNYIVKQFGNEPDAKIYYDGTDLVAQTDVVGIGSFKTTAGRIKNTTRLTAGAILDGTYNEVFCNGTFTVTLPASPTDGQTYRIINSGIGAITIDPNGNNLTGSAATYVLSAGNVLIITYETTDGWY